MKISNSINLILLVNLLIAPVTLAQMNGLSSPLSGVGGMPIGAGMPGTGGSLADPGGPASGAVNMQGSQGSPTEYTEDEKQQQKKYKATIKHLQKLIDDGNKMMKEGKLKNNDKLYKKGKVKKEIGERQLDLIKQSDPLEQPQVLK